ncbi:hypothetical protein GCM10009660_29980 [Catellatospora bangladeshensis]
MTALAVPAAKPLPAPHAWPAAAVHSGRDRARAAVAVLLAFQAVGRYFVFVSCPEVEVRADPVTGWAPPAVAPTRTRAVPVLRFAADLPVTEAARALRRSERSVKARPARGPAVLRRLLGKGGVMTGSDFPEPLRAVEPGPARGVDIARAARGGRDRRHRGARRRVAAAVAEAVLAVVVLPAALRGLSAEPPPLGAGVFDPLRQVARVGSAGGFAPLCHETGRHRQKVTLGHAHDPAGGPRGTLVVHAAGRLPGQGGAGWQPAGDRAPDVGGRPAWWRGGAELVWEWSPQAWAVVRVEGFPDLRERAHRVAQGLDTSVTTPVTAPFTLAPGEPVPPLRLAGVRVPVRPDVELASVLLTAGDSPEAPVLSVALRTDGLPGRDLPEEERIAGRPAASSDSRVTVLDPSGRFAVRVEVGRGDATAFGGRAGLAALAAATTPVPDPADRGTWVADPLTGP